MGFDIAGVHHVTFAVTDLDRARDFYEGVLGLTKDQDFEGYKLRFKLGPYSRLVLVKPLPGTPTGDRFSEFRIGLDHISLGVPDRANLERLVGVLTAAGIENSGIQRDKADPEHGPGLVCFRDPDNIAWEFFEETA
jgi:glyoxylase I family protein